MKKRLMKSVLLVGGLLASLVSCGGTGPSGGGNSGKITIKFWHTFGDIPEKALEDKAATFKAIVKENEGVDVEVDLSYQGGYNDMVNKVQLGIATSDSPSIAVAYPDHVADYLNFEGGKYCVDMYQFANDATLGFGKDKYLGDTEGIGDFVKAFIDEGSHFAKQGLYVMPYMKSSEAMLYNLDLATIGYRIWKGDNTITPEKVEEGISKLTWDELMDLGQCCATNKDKINNVLEYPISYDSDGNLFITKMYQNKIPFAEIGSDGKGKILFESGDASTKAQALVKDFYNKHKAGILTTKAIEGTYASNKFKAEQTIFCIGSTGGVGYSFPNEGTFNFRVCKVPASNNNPVYVSQGPSLTMFNRPDLTKEENEKTLKYSWKFLKYITSTNVNMELCVSGSQGYSPVRESCYVTEAYQEFQAGGTMYAETAKVVHNDIDGSYFYTPVFPGSAELRKQCEGIIGTVLKDKDKYATDKDVDEAIADTFANAIRNAKLVIK